jgi:integrase
MSSSPRLPKLQFHGATRQGRIWLHGRDVYLGPWGDGDKHHPSAACLAAYHRAVAEWLGSGATAAARAVPAPQRTVTQVLVPYLAFARDYYRDADGSDTGQYERVVAALAPVEALYGDTPADEFDSLKLKAVRAELLRRPSRKDPAKRLARGYVNNLIGCVQTAFTWLASERLVADAVAASLRTVTALRRGKGGVEAPPVLPADPAAVEATLPHLLPVVRAMVELQRLTGMRPGEVCRLTPAEVSTDPARPIVVTHGDRPQKVAALRVGETLVWVYGPSRHKTCGKGKARLVAIGPQGQAVLGPYLADREPGAHCFCPVESVRLFHCQKRAARKSKVQPSQVDRSRPYRRTRPGPFYTPDSYRHAVQRACRRAGVPLWSPNQLRHTVADMVSERHDEDTASAVLGNTPDIVRVYTLQRLGKAAAVMARCG